MAPDIKIDGAIAEIVEAFFAEARYECLGLAMPG